MGESGSDERIGWPGGDGADADDIFDGAAEWGFFGAERR